jgi:DtxR family Mn-dependent transcriptional regulator
MKAEEASISHQAEEYLETIYRLEKKRSCAKTMELARKLNVFPGSITNTIEGLERRGYVINKPYKGVKLTEKGRKIASNVLRRYRLAERFLTDILHLDWSQVHDEACKLEHALSPEILNSLEDTLRHPKTCPHGNPIPTKKGKITEEKIKPLTDLNTGESGVVVKIAKEKTDTLITLDIFGLTPRSHVKIARAKNPSSGHSTFTEKENVTQSNEQLQHTFM